jgi:hypothetical protein
MTTTEDYYGTPDDHARVAKARVDDLAQQFQKRLRARQHTRDVAVQSATQYATKVLGKPVKFLDELTEQDFASLMLALNGGRNE